MFNRHDFNHFLSQRANSARTFRKVWTWAAPILAVAFLAADPRPFEWRNLVIAVAIVGGGWLLGLLVEAVNKAMRIDPD